MRGYIISRPAVYETSKERSNKKKEELVLWIKALKKTYSKCWSETLKGKEEISHTYAYKRMGKILKSTLQKFICNTVDWIVLMRGRVGGIRWRQRILGFNEVWRASWQLRQSLISQTILRSMHLVAQLLINKFTVSVTTSFHISALKESGHVLTSPYYSYYVLTSWKLRT